jgi:hypothetical protein
MVTQPHGERRRAVEGLVAVLLIPRVHELPDELEVTGSGIRHDVKPAILVDGLAN